MMVAGLCGLLDRFPDLGAQLNNWLDRIDFIHAVALQLGAVTLNSSPENSAAMPPPHSALEDYRIIRELGRGGMGVVYEAEQLSMRRRVALKVLPLASVMDPRQIARFKNEAQAAGLLQHNNIVPVYGVGGNEQAARLSGLNVDRIKLWIYTLAGGLSAVAGLIVTSRLDSAQPNAGTGYELDSIAAVVIGGTSLSGGRGSIWGTMVGCLIIGVS